MDGYKLVDEYGEVFGYRCGCGREYGAIQMLKSHQEIDHKE